MAWDKTKSNEDEYAVRGEYDRENPLDPLTKDGQSVEKSKPLQALRDYALLGPARSFSRLHKRYTEAAANSAPPPTTSLDTIKYWSRIYDWQARIAVWDRLEADRELLDWEARKRELREKDWSQGGDLRDKVALFLEQLPRFLQDSVQERVETLDDGTLLKTRVITVGLNTSLNQIAQALQSASKLQRLATDEPTENITVSGAALDSLIERELRALAAATHSRETPLSETTEGEESAD